MSKWNIHEGPIDIWINENQIPAIKKIIAMNRFAEWYKWYGGINDTEKQRKAAQDRWVEEKAPNVTLDDVLDMLGNSGKRTVTIVGEGPFTGRYERKPAKQCQE